MYFQFNGKVGIRYMQLLSWEMFCSSASASACFVFLRVLVMTAKSIEFLRAAF